MKQKIKFKQIGIEKKLQIAIKKLVEKDKFLIENGASERAVSHKLAEYLKDLFSKYNIDIEYNRHSSDIKKLDDKRVFPDIIVHERNTDENNLLIVEIKTNSDKIENDIKKLKNFTLNSKGYKYRYGVFIKFDGIKYIMRWFKNGQEIQTN